MSGKHVIAAVTISAIAWAIALEDNRVAELERQVAALENKCHELEEAK